MLSEKQLLLNAVIANPDDDAPRWVYADWLEEHGEEQQAAYIREALAKPDMVGRRYNLIELAFNDVFIERRGFMDEAHLNTADYMQLCHSIAAEHPVRKWVLKDFAPAVITLPEGIAVYVVRQISACVGIAQRQPWQLPLELFRYLKKGDVNVEVYGVALRRYASNTFEEVMEDVGQACYHYARRKLEFLPAEPDKLLKW